MQKINWETQSPSSDIVCSVHKIFLFNFIFFFLEPPLVKVNRKETFPGVTTLVCRAYGFYPPEISMIWMKNGEEIIQEMDYSDILPSGDGTYQTWVSVELDPQSSDLYSCHVEHCDVQMVLQVPQGKDRVCCLGNETRRRGERGVSSKGDHWMLSNASFKSEVLLLFGLRDSLCS